MINNFDNYSSNSIICDDLKQKYLHTLSYYWINFPTKNSTWRTAGAILLSLKPLIYVVNIFSRVNQSAGNLYGEMETDVFFDIKMVTTDKQQRKSGLATELLRRSVELARNLGFKAVKTEATGMKIYESYEYLLGRSLAGQLIGVD